MPLRYKNMSQLNAITELLKKDLLISIRGNKDKLVVQDDYIVVYIPNNEKFDSSFRDLCHILTTSLYDQNAKRVAIKITNGLQQDHIYWEF